MPDTTIDQSIIEPCADSLVFGCLSPIVHKSTLDFIPVMGRVLNWSQLAQKFLADVVRLLPDAPDAVLTLKHIEFAAILFPDIPEQVGARRISRGVKALKQDQLLSGWQAVWVEVGDRVSIGAGKFEWIPTSYRQVDYFAVVFELQELAMERDIMALPQARRRKAMLQIAVEICDARRYQRIPARARQQRHFQPEVKAKAEPEPKVVSLPASLPYTKALDWYCEQLLAHLTSLGKGRADAGFTAAVDEAGRAIRRTEKKALDIIHGRVKAGGVR